MLSKFNPLCTEFHLGKNRNTVWTSDHFWTMRWHWEWISFNVEGDKPGLSYIGNIMPADDLGLQGTKVSAALVLTQSFLEYSSICATKLILCWWAVFNQQQTFQRTYASSIKLPHPTNIVLIIYNAIDCGHLTSKYYLMRWSTIHFYVAAEALLSRFFFYINTLMTRQNGHNFEINFSCMKNVLIWFKFH